MIKIFKDKSGEFLIQTTCLDADSFIIELAEALTLAIEKNDGGLAALGILQNAFPIAFKLSGYKAETVREQQSLVCGNATPSEDSLITSVGR